MLIYKIWTSKEKDESWNDDKRTEVVKWHSLAPFGIKLITDCSNTHGENRISNLANQEGETSNSWVELSNLVAVPCHVDTESGGAQIVVEMSNRIGPHRSSGKSISWEILKGAVSATSLFII